MKFSQLACALSSSAILIAGLIASPAAVAQKLSSAEQAYVGGYTQGGVDSIARLILLDDYTFCFAFTGGALDLRAAGKWKSNGKDGGISLKEVKPDQADFVAYIDQSKKQGSSVVFDLDGYSISNATSAVFATSSTEARPASFRPLFEEDKNNWADHYTLEAIPTDKAAYFFIGYVEVDQYRQPVRVKVIQYKMGNSSSVRIGFNNVQAMPPINYSAKLSGNNLQLDGQHFGRKDILPAEIIEDVRQNCVDPVLRPTKQKQDQEVAEQNWSGLKPVKTFYADLKSIKGLPLIKTKE